MKLYEKIIDGKQHCKPANKIVIVKDGMQIFNPTEEMLLEDGWTIHVPEVHELTEEEILNQTKENYINEILMYDSSDVVNTFYVNNIQMWLDKATRAGLMLRLQSELAVGLENTSLWYNGVEFVLPVSLALQMLYNIEIYASKCYDRTQYHLAEIQKIETTNELKLYDYTTGYPDYLHFNFE